MESVPERFVDLPQADGVAEELLRRGYGLRVAFRGGSMTPLLQEGDAILVVPLAGRPRPGAVLLYGRAERLVAHRYLRAAPEGYVCKGDAVPGPGERVAPSQVLGEVAWIERGGRRIALRTGPGALLQPLAALVSPWLPGLVHAVLPPGLRRAARNLVRLLWRRSLSS